MLKVDLEQLRALVESGGALSITLEGKGRHFAMKIETRRGEAVLVVANDKERIRTFTDPLRALLLLRELGIREVRVNTRDWNPTV